MPNFTRQTQFLNIDSAKLNQEEYLNLLTNIVNGKISETITERNLSKANIGQLNKMFITLNPNKHHFLLSYKGYNFIGIINSYSRHNDTVTLINTTLMYFNGRKLEKNVNFDFFYSPLLAEDLIIKRFKNFTDEDVQCSINEASVIDIKTEKTPNAILINSLMVPPEHPDNETLNEKLLEITTLFNKKYNLKTDIKEILESLQVIVESILQDVNSTTTLEDFDSKHLKYQEILADLEEDKKIKISDDLSSYEIVEKNISDANKPKIQEFLIIREKIVQINKYIDELISNDSYADDLMSKRRQIEEADLAELNQIQLEAFLALQFRDADAEIKKRGRKPRFE